MATHHIDDAGLIVAFELLLVLMVDGTDIVTH